MIIGSEVLRASLLDLPTEILLEIFKTYDSFYSFKALLETSRSTRDLLRSFIVAIGDNESGDDGEMFGLDYVDIQHVSLDSLELLIKKYHYFIFKIDNDRSSDGARSRSIRMLKILLHRLQEKEIYHTVTITTMGNFNSCFLLRSLLPKCNSKYTEFFFPNVTKINGFDDLRLLDNTRCYFQKLEGLTIGSYSFQLFNIKAPNLKMFNFSEQLKEIILNENVSVGRLSYSQFLDNIAELSSGTLTHLEIVNKVDPFVLDKFTNLKVLKIYGDNITVDFHFKHFDKLEIFVINKCNSLKTVLNLENGRVNTSMKLLDLSQNKHFCQKINVDFENLKVLAE